MRKGGMGSKSALLLREGEAALLGKAGVLLGKGALGLQQAGLTDQAILRCTVPKGSSRG